MSAAQARGKGNQLTVWVRLRRGGVQRSIGSSSRRTLAAVQDMLADLYARDDAWDVLEALRQGGRAGRRLPDGRRYTLRVLLDFYSGNALGRLREALRAVDLRELLTPWQEALQARGRVPIVVDHYRRQTVRLMTAIMGEDPAPWLAARLTAAAIEDALTALPVSPGTRLKNLRALSSFLRFARKRGAIASNPIADVERPKKNPARLRWETADVVQRLVAWHPLDGRGRGKRENGMHWRAYFALVFGTGAEVSAALAMTRADLDLDRGTCHVPGTKNPSRDRHGVEIEPWALPILREAFGSILPHARVPLFPGTVTRYAVTNRHVAACAALGVEDFHVHDARHCIAVWWRQRGRPLEEIAEQLGHAGIGSTLVYARFKPSDARERALHSTDYSTMRAAAGAGKGDRS